MKNDENKKLDLDLIQMVQQARMLNDEQASPSAVNAVYWIEAKSPVGQPTTRAGKWVIATTVDAVDNIWDLIQDATRKGQLGYKSKVSTSPGKNQANASDRIIHVRMGDSDDAQELKRVKEVLLAMGIAEEQLQYLRD